MVFGWLYRGIGRVVIGQFEEWLQDPKHIEELTKLVDSFVDREVQRIYSSLGASMQSMKNSEPSGGIDLGGLLSGKGGLSSKKLIGTALQWWLSRKQEGQTGGGLP